jgi:para-nitrobenzyl esterase
LRVVPDFPTVDGAVMTHKALEAFSKSLFNQVPIMTGLVADEQAYFLAEPNTGVPLTPEAARPGMGEIRAGLRL